MRRCIACEEISCVSGSIVYSCVVHLHTSNRGWGHTKLVTNVENICFCTFYNASYTPCRAQKPFPIRHEAEYSIWSSFFGKMVITENGHFPQHERQMCNFQRWNDLKIIKNHQKSVQRNRMPCCRINIQLQKSASIEPIMDNARESSSRRGPPMDRESSWKRHGLVLLDGCTEAGTTGSVQSAVPKPIFAKKIQHISRSHEISR